MANFDSGVKTYIRGYATVEATFPVDWNGNADICCCQCRFFRRSSQSCALNGQICEYPSKYVGSYCPLELLEKREENDE